MPKSTTYKKMTSIHQEYQLIYNTFNQLRHEIENDINNSKFPKTGKALLIFTDKIDEISKTLTPEITNFYTSQVLTRVIFEHYLVSDYLYTRSKLDLSDNVGQEYYKEYLCGEFFKRFSYSKQVDQIIDNNPEKKTQLEIIKESLPEFEDLTNAELQRIFEIKNSFYDLKKIGKYLIKSETEKYSIANFNKAKLDLIKRYSDLSSYVHGGPLAERDFMTLDIQKKEEIVKENVDWSKLASKLSKLNLLNLLTGEFGLKYLKVLKIFN